jgi:dihydrofolate reductase
MKVICVMVMSIDGKITKDNDPHPSHWSSQEDKIHFLSLIGNYNLLIMGRTTYTQSKHMMEHIPGKLRVILTKNPQKYAHETLPDILEFSNKTPKILLKLLEEKGYKKALLLGGGDTNSLFLKENCVDELWLTIEPLLFGKGKPLIGEKLLSTKLQLFSIKKLNQQGTLLAKYTIVK